jgi:REP element-mobilizing transposase RayT
MNTFVLLLTSLFIVGCSNNREQVEKEQFTQEITQALHDYEVARNQDILFNCTQSLAELNHIHLSADFYKRQQELSNLKRANQTRLVNAISQAKQQFGSTLIPQADELLQKIRSDTTNDITWDYCNRYQDVIGINISHTLAHYKMAVPDV